MSGFGWWIVPARSLTITARDPAADWCTLAPDPLRCDSCTLFLAFHRCRSLSLRAFLLASVLQDSTCTAAERTIRRTDGN